MRTRATPSGAVHGSAHGANAGSRTDRNVCGWPFRRLCKAKLQCCDFLAGAVFEQRHLHALLVCARTFFYYAFHQLKYECDMMWFWYVDSGAHTRKTMRAFERCGRGCSKHFERTTAKGVSTLHWANWPDTSEYNAKHTERREMISNEILSGPDPFIYWPLQNEIIPTRIPFNPSEFGSAESAALRHRLLK